MCMVKMFKTCIYILNYTELDLQLHKNVGVPFFFNFTKAERFPHLNLHEKSVWAF